MTIEDCISFEDALDCYNSLKDSDEFQTLIRYLIIGGNVDIVANLNDDEILREVHFRQVLRDKIINFKNS